MDAFPAAEHFGSWCLDGCHARDFSPVVTTVSTRSSVTDQLFEDLTTRNAEQRYSVSVDVWHGFATS